MRKLSHEEISRKRISLDIIDSIEKLPVVVVLNSIRSSYNVGSIFRTSDAAQIEKLIMCGFTPSPPNKDILKTALGATESVKWEYNKDTLEVVRQYKSKNYTIVALELTESSKPYTDLDSIAFPVCFVIGNEINGVSQDILDMCDFALEIPQYGIKQSMNVAVAYGISIYEFRNKFDKIKISI